MFHSLIYFLSWSTKVIRISIQDFSSVEVQQSSAWQTIQETSPDLHHRKDILADLLLKDKAPSTRKAYVAAFHKWTQRANLTGLPAFPAQPAHIALYMVHLHQCGSLHAVSQFSAALSWLHNKAGAEDPTRSPVIRQLHEAIRRLLAQPIQRRHPLLPEGFNRVITSLLSPTMTLSDLQSAALIALGFTAFLRWDDLHRLTAGDFTFHESHMCIRLAQRKNDQFREGQSVVVSRSGDPRLCPVDIVQQFLTRGNHRPDDPVFRRVFSAPRTGDRLSGKMSYTRARERLREALSRAGINPAGYGLHSLRSGGASTAARAGVSDRLLQRHGGWRSEASRNMYIEDSLQALLPVSQSILLPS